MSEGCVGYAMQEHRTLLDTFWLRFNENFGSERACIDELFSRFELVGQIKCHHCGCKSILRSSGERFFVCRECTETSWFTSSTLFHGAKKIQPYLAYIMLREAGLNINSIQLHKRIAIATSSALEIILKVSTVMLEQLTDNSMTLSSARFMQLFSKRSSQTPARQHPREEEGEPPIVSSVTFFETDYADQKCESSSDFDAEFPCAFKIGSKSDSNHFLDSIPSPEESNIIAQINDLQNKKNFVFSQFNLLEKLQFETLIEKTKMSISELSATLTSLEINALITRLPGDFYVLSRKAYEQNHSDNLGANPQIRNLVENIVSSLQESNHGISRKNLQKYVASYCFQMESVLRKTQDLLSRCIRSRPIRIFENRNYVSPALIEISSKMTLENMDQSRSNSF